jgi:hypothetical protein
LAEWRKFYADDPSGERALLLPVRVEQVEPPGLLRTRVYVDLVERDAASRVMTAIAVGKVAIPQPPDDR